jgi:hypothetical protein
MGLELKTSLAHDMDLGFPEEFLKDILEVFLHHLVPRGNDVGRKTTTKDGKPSRLYSSRCLSMEVFNS